MPNRNHNHNHHHNHNHNHHNHHNHNNQSCSLHEPLHLRPPPRAPWLGPWPAVARKRLNPARGPLAVALPYGGSLLSVGERGRAPCRRPLPRQKTSCFTVFCALRMFSHFSDLVVSAGSTWAKIGLKMGQHRPPDGPT